MVIILILIPLVAIGTFNYYIDPLWNFSHQNRFNIAQMPFDERQQKTNYLTFTEEDYDSLLLGSSRCTYIKQNDFKTLKVYNYALSNILIEEYLPYIKYACKQKGQDYENIIIGLDFYATNQNTEKNFHPPSFYIEQSNSFAYRYKTLLSQDVLRYARQNYQAAQAPQLPSFTYDRNNEKRLHQISVGETEKKITATVEKYRQDIYADYVYAPVREQLQELKNSFPNSNFIIFTTPISPGLFQLMMELELYPFYEQWLRDSVAVFGAVYHFMNPNSITRDLHNFYDGSHVYPEIGTLMVDRIMDYPNDKLPADFGILLDGENLENELQKMRACL